MRILWKWDKKKKCSGSKLWFRQIDVFLKKKERTRLNLRCGLYFWFADWLNRKQEDRLRGRISNRFQICISLSLEWKRSRNVRSQMKESVSTFEHGVLTFLHVAQKITHRGGVKSAVRAIAAIPMHKCNLDFSPKASWPVTLVDK